ncbi:HNH endonuclease [Egicoccus sp. AB-alg6-2]|uniref:HNH endonuclease signature motif containing protein n=1 Tax=Egicoccus sp. AB-alg6-2 TaxID=3242692 RepID=UPI00359D28A9
MGRRRYTEVQFRAAVADPGTKTMADLCRALGLVPRGANYETVYDYAAELGIDLRFLARPTARHVSDADFLAAVAAASGYPDLCRRLGLKACHPTYRRLRERGRQLGQRLPAEWSRRGPRPSPGTTGDGKGAKSFPEHEFRRAVLGNFSIAAVIRDLGFVPCGTAYARFAASVASYEVDLTHFGSAGTRVRFLLDKLAPELAANTANRFTDLGRRLVSVGLKTWACERCGLTEWQGREVPLELDHVNGDRRDNRLQNLRLLCPNCHALTPTYRGRNRGARARHSREARSPDADPSPRPMKQLALV